VATTTFDNGNGTNIANDTLNWDNGLPGTGDIAVFDGTAAVVCDWDLVAGVGEVQINSGYTSTVTLSTNMNLVTSGGGNADLTVAAGTLADGGNTINMAGSPDFTGGTISFSGLLVTNGTTQTLTSAGETLADLSISGSITLVDALVTDVFIVTSTGTITDDGNTISSAGDLLMDDNATIISTARWTQTASGDIKNTGDPIFELEIATGVTSTMLDNVVCKKFITTGTGTIAIPSAKIIVLLASGINDQLDVVAGSVTGSGGNINFTVNDTDSVTQKAFDVDTNVQMTIGTTATLTATGSFEVGSGMDLKIRSVVAAVDLATSGTLDMDTFNVTTGRDFFYKSSSPGNTFLLQLKLGSGTHTVGRNFNNDSAIDGGGFVFWETCVFNISGSIDMKKITSDTTGTAIINHVGTSGTPTLISSMQTMPSLNMNNDGVTSFRLLDDMTMDGDFTVAADGVFGLNGKTIDINGSFDNQGGLGFGHGTGVFEFTGNAAITIDGTTTFGTLKMDLAVSKTVTWDNTATFTFADDVTIKTTTTNLITMVSDSPATQYSWDVQGTQDIVRVNCTDCDASTGTQVRAISSEKDGQNTLNWIFINSSLKGIEILVQSNKIFPPVVKGVEIIVDETVTPIFPTEELPARFDKNNYPRWFRGNRV